MTPHHDEESRVSLVPLLSAQVLREIMSKLPEVGAEVHAAALSRWMRAYEISTVTRAACFLAQCAWESDRGGSLVEADGTAYEGRRSLGNTEPGDGHLFRGRGWIHLTGRANYKWATVAIQGAKDMELDPEAAAEPELAARVACAYWDRHSLSELADALDYREITRQINGMSSDGPPSYHLRRQEIMHRALAVLGRGVQL